MHFFDNTQIDDLERALVDDLRTAGIRTAYVDYLEIAPRTENIASLIGRLLVLKQAPYASQQEWTAFSEDLAALSQSETSVAIIVDNADQFLSADRKTMLKLIAAFQAQFAAWIKQNKPCHLCFQMEKNDLVRHIFRTA